MSENSASSLHASREQPPLKRRRLMPEELELGKVVVGNPAFRFYSELSGQSSDSVKLCRPTRLGDFCLDGGRRYLADKSRLRYMAWPKGRRLGVGESVSVCWDLNVGLDQARRKEDWKLDERLDSLLRWVKDNRHRTKSAANSSKTVGADFVCYRGLLTKLMNSPYERRESWIICATLWKGTIYLCKYDTPDQIEANRNRSHRHSMMCSWGYKFEQHLTAEKHNGSPCTDTPVDESEEYCCVYGSTLGRYNLVYAAEMDALDLDVKDSAASKFIELKTTRFCYNVYQQRTLHWKMLRWWAQSYLVNIDSVVVGYRDDTGVVSRVERLDTHSLPKLQELWSHRVCFNGLYRFLHYIRHHPLLVDDPCCVLKFELCPLDGSVSSSRVTGTSELAKYRILPEWYIKSLT